MRRGRPLKPIISIESITTALKKLDYSSQGQSDNHVLQNLQLIDFYLQSANRPLAENIRTWMLNKILVDFITSALNEIRHYFDLKPISDKQSRQNEAKSLSEVSQLESPELLGWSIRYVRYVRPELGFSMQEIAELLHVNERTVRRYQGISINKLRDILIEAEWQTRKEQQVSYLKSQIPHQIIDIVGRENELVTIFSHLDQSFSSPIFITGETGIGKSAVCAKVAYTLIDEKKIDYLIWLRQPNDFGAIQTKIWNVISPHVIQKHWREILEHQKLLFIIEDVDALVDKPEWDDLLINLQNAYVLITSEKSSPHFPNIHNIHLKPLSRKSSHILLEQFFANRLSDIQADTIIDSTFGNPRKIIEISQRSVQEDEELGGVLENYHAEQFNSLSYSDKSIILLNTFSKDGVDKRILDNVLNTNPDRSLRYKFLIEKGSLVYLPDSYIDYIENRLLLDTELQSLAKNLINHLLENTTQDLTTSKILLDFLDNASNSWDRSVAQNILETINVGQITIGDVYRWRNLYLRYFGLDNDENLELSILAYKYGIALRRLHHMHSEEYLISLIESLGNKGYFALQVQVSFELALFYQHSASFEQAIEIYNHITRTLSQYASTEILSAIQLHYARIAIARQNIDSTLEALQGCNLEHLEVFILFCEAQLLKGEYDFIIGTIPNYLNNTILSHKLQTSLHTILARSYQATNLYNKAIIHFNEALSISEQYLGKGDIARARNNFASIYLITISQQSPMDLDNVEDLLLETQELQRQIKDLVGLEASTRNLRYLRAYRVKPN